MKILSLFSGIGAFEKALDNLGIEYELAGYSEIDKYAVKSYCAIHGVTEELNLGDITKINEKSLPKDLDLITYGFPCQDISLAGKQKGMFNADGTQTRSGLFFEALRIIEETQPKVAIAENVKNLTSKKFKLQFDIVLRCLEAAGYNNYWKVLNAKDYGIPQNRERVFIVSIRKDVDNGTFEFPQGFPLELRLKDMLEEQVDEKFYLSDKMVAGFTKHNEHHTAKGTGFLWKPRDPEGCASTLRANAALAPTDNTIIQVAQMYPNSGNPQAGRIYDAEGISPAMDTCQGGNRMPKITVLGNYSPSGHDASRIVDGDDLAPTVKENHGTVTAVVEPIIYDDYNNRVKADQTVIGTLTTNIGSSTPRNGTKIIEPFIVASRGRNPENPSDRTAGAPTEQRLEPNSQGICNTLTTVQKDNYVVVPEATKKGYAEAVEGDSINLEQPNSKTRRGRVGHGVAQTLTTSPQQAAVMPELRIRKLTPKECYRLMGFDDIDHDRAAEVVSNSQLYKQAGNSIVVDVLEHLLPNVLKAVK